MAQVADASFISRRGLVFLVIVAVHVGFFWALNSGLSHKMVQKVFGPLVTDIIEEEKVQEEEEPPPPPPKIETPPPYVPPPEVAIEMPTEAPPATAITTTTTQRPVAPPPPVAKPPGVKPRIDPKRPPSQPEYPPTSRRLGEQGTVTLEILVLENGRIGEAKVAKSSGFPRLDEAAVREVKRTWRLIPGTEGGKPVQMWHQINVTFRLTD
ncbi:MAG TPA: energy transducer TonB [Steroidobacteraceae bacterium]|nr:energy transducer TonB [Steroidobacteraceae bacterium]